MKLRWNLSYDNQKLFKVEKKKQKKMSKLKQKRNKEIKKINVRESSFSFDLQNDIKLESSFEFLFSQTPRVEKYVN